MPSSVSGVRADAIRLVDAEVNDGNVAFIAGGSGNPIPNAAYVHDMSIRFTLPDFPDHTPEAFFEPNGNYPTAQPIVKQLIDDTSVHQGSQLMNIAITKEVAEGNHVVMFGNSQSSTVSSLTMTELAQENVPSSDVSFVLVGDPMNPNGGLFERAPGLTTPSIGHTFEGATPDDLYPTTIWTAEYESFADVPRYPIDILSDLNNIMATGHDGHTLYRHATAEQLESAIKLPTTGDTMTTYYMIPNDDLPLLDQVREMPVVGQPLHDLLLPILKPLVNLGYGDPDFGWDQGPANVPTEFGLFPEPDMVLKALEEAVAGIPKGIQAAANDLESLNLSDLWSLLTPGTSAALSTAETTVATDPVSALNDIIDEFTAAVSRGYSVLLPVTDLLFAEAVSVPNYGLKLFEDGLESGNLLEAVGQPFATGMYLEALLSAVIQSDITRISTEVQNDFTQIVNDLSNLSGL
jgi:hypothetical protein